MGSASRFPASDRGDRPGAQWKTCHARNTSGLELSELSKSAWSPEIPRWMIPAPSFESLSTGQMHTQAWGSRVGWLVLASRFAEIEHRHGARAYQSAFKQYRYIRQILGPFVCQNQCGAILRSPQMCLCCTRCVLWTIDKGRNVTIWKAPGTYAIPKGPLWS